MSKSFHAIILEADGTFYEGPLESLILPIEDGLIGIKAGHSNLISAIVPGMLTYRIPEQKDQYAAISGGLLKVEEGEVLILAETIERPEEIDVERARRAEDAAREALLQKRSVREFRLAKFDLARTVNRLKVKKHVPGE